MATWTWRIAAMQSAQATLKRVTCGIFLAKQRSTLTNWWNSGRKCMSRAHKVKTLDSGLDAALARAKQFGADEVRVTRATYEERTDVVSLALTNGATTSFPRKWLQGLK